MVADDDDEDHGVRQPNDPENYDPATGAYTGHDASFQEYLEESNSFGVSLMEELLQDHEDTFGEGLSDVEGDDEDDVMEVDGEVDEGEEGEENEEEEGEDATMGGMEAELAYRPKA
jgi:hypothetical protein